jgi:hypothetical protein
MALMFKKYQSHDYGRGDADESHTFARLSLMIIVNVITAKVQQDEVDKAHNLF